MDLKDRKRSFNIDKLSPAEADLLGAQIGDKIREISDKAVQEANKILNVYGMKAYMKLAITGINEEIKKTEEDKPKKKGRKARKDANL
jgi:hypothetical protein